MNIAALAVLATALTGNQFGYDLYDELRAEEGNLVVSPASVSTALSMAYAGAEGDTQSEMASVLHFDPDTPEEKIHADAADLLAALQFSDEEEGYGLTIANRLWVQNGFGLHVDFVDVTTNSYGAEVGLAEFVTAPETARGEINAWVEENTAGKIQDLFPSGSIDDMTRVVLANTVYFRDKWQSQFVVENTRQAPFFVTPEDSVDCQLMYQKHRFGYAQGDDYQLLEMPYGTDPNFAMLVVLPGEGVELSTLEEELSDETVAGWIDELSAQQVEVYLPRFRAESEFSLNDALIELGMPAAFDADAADFSGITQDAELYLSAAQHKTFIEVSEWGTEAAAATGLAFGVRSAPVGPPAEFRADRPFLFLIHDRESGAVLFLGRIVEPGG